MPSESPSVALTGFDRLTAKVSFDSTFVSPLTDTVIVALGVLAGIVSVPLRPM